MEREGERESAREREGKRLDIERMGERERDERERRERRESKSEERVRERGVPKGVYIHKQHTL